MVKMVWSEKGGWRENPEGRLDENLRDKTTRCSGKETLGRLERMLPRGFARGFCIDPGVGLRGFGS